MIFLPEVPHIHRIGQTIYKRCIYSIYGREITKYTVIYGVYARFWPTLHIHRIYTALANPTHITMSKDHRSGQPYTYHYVKGSQIWPGTVRANPTHKPYIHSSGQPYIYTVYTQFWPTLHIHRIYTVLANPTHIAMAKNHSPHAEG